MIIAFFYESQLAEGVMNLTATRMQLYKGLSLPHVLIDVNLNHYFKIVFRQSEKDLFEAFISMFR